MFLKKEDLINLAMDTGVLVASGTLLKHCVEVNDKWTLQAEFKETKNDKGETVYIRIPGSGKLVNKSTLKEISNFKILMNTVGKFVAIYGLLIGGVKFGADFVTAITNQRCDRKFNGYWKKYLEIVENKSLNITQKEEAVSCLRTQYGYVNLFEKYDDAQQMLINSTIKTLAKQDREKVIQISSMLDDLEKGKKEAKKEYLEKPEKVEVDIQIVSQQEEIKKEIPKQNMNTALENQKPAVYDSI